MPNWCETKYVITGSKEEINQLNAILQNVSKEAKQSNRSNLYLFVKELGFENDDINCRGSFDNVRLCNKTTLRLTTWTAWVPCYEVFEFMKKKLPSLRYYYKANEPACSFFETNDIEKKYFKCREKYVKCDEAEMMRRLFYERYFLNWKDVYGKGIEEQKMLEEQVRQYIQKYY